VRLAAGMGLCMLLAACGSTTVYQPVNYDEMHGRRAIFLDSVYLPPIDRNLHTRIVAQAERELSRFPHLGGVVTREDARARMRGSARLRRDFQLSSEALSVVGVAERETASRLGKALDAELLVMVQVVFTPCPRCEEGSQLALIGSVVETRTARLLWRGHFIQNFGDYSDELLGEESEEMLGEFFELLDEDLRPKWQRQRFSNLARGKAA
jgi:hypothetical protein